MAKQGMRRPDPEQPHGTESNKINHFSKNDLPPVPEIQGKAKHGHEKANPVINATQSPALKVYHGNTSSKKESKSSET
jgi:hypothetical protein